MCVNAVMFDVFVDVCNFIYDTLPLRLYNAAFEGKNKMWSSDFKAKTNEGIH